MNTIRLQLIEGCFYPTDGVSRQHLIDECRLERFPEHRFNELSPVLVKRGYKLAVVDYMPVIRQDTITQVRYTGNKGKSVKNPCVSCSIKNVCDTDDCGRKIGRLHKYNKR